MESVPPSGYLSYRSFRIVVSLAHGCDAHEPPPEAVIEAPVGLASLLREVEKAWQGQDANADQDHQQEDFLVNLSQSWEKTLQTSEMLDKLE